MIKSTPINDTLAEPIETIEATIAHVPKYFSPAPAPATTRARDDVRIEKVSTVFRTKPNGFDLPKRVAVNGFQSEKLWKVEGEGLDRVTYDVEINNYSWVVDPLTGETKTDAALIEAQGLNQPRRKRFSRTLEASGCTMKRA